MSKVESQKSKIKVESQKSNVESRMSKVECRKKNKDHLSWSFFIFTFDKNVIGGKMFRFNQGCEKDSPEISGGNPFLMQRRGI